MVPAKTACHFLSPVLVCFLLIAPKVAGQQTQLIEPEHRELLNGLQILIWPRPADPQVLLKLRIHSGAAFDLADKAGEMSLLADILFPDPATREYFEQMEGRLNVVTNYDSITITMLGKAAELERIVEVLRNAIVATPLTPELVASVRNNRVKIARESTISPEMLADRAIASRLFGSFPYGRPYAGSAESLARIERADLMLARERFLNPNNATLAIAGGVQTPRVMRALRQLLGNWRRSEQVVPSTFRPPESPDVRTLVVNAPSDESVEIRLATRGLARKDHDNAAATLLTDVIQRRWERSMPELVRSRTFVRHEPRSMPGIFVLGASAKMEATSRVVLSAQQVLKELVSAPITNQEVEEARARAIARANEGLTNSERVLEAWLDLSTYKLSSISDELKALQTVNPGDLQRVAAKLFNNRPIATVVVGNSEALRAALEPEVPIEVIGETRSTQTTSPPSKSTGKPD